MSGESWSPINEEGQKFLMEKEQERCKNIYDAERWTQKAFPIIKQIVDKYDPESLLKLECPNNEYDSVSKNITEAMDREDVLKNIKKIPILHIAYIIALSMHILFRPWSERIKYHKLYIKMARELSRELIKNNLLND